MLLLPQLLLLPSLLPMLPLLLLPLPLLGLGLPEAATYALPPVRPVAEAPIVEQIVEPVEQWRVQGCLLITTFTTSSYYHLTLSPLETQRRLQPPAMRMT